jgi:hypothetical protein
MQGAHAGLSFGLVIVGVLLVIALAVAASPLIAVFIAGVAVVVLLVAMVGQRRRSAREDQTEGGADTHSDPTARRARGTSGGRSSGEPVSGEG